MKKFTVSKRGEISFLQHANESFNFTDVKYVMVERVSHVEPFDPVKRFFFHKIREYFPRLTQWTRTWKCYWQVRFVSQPNEPRGPFRTRENAIKFEVQYLDGVDN